MSIEITTMQDDLIPSWDSYVRSHPNGTLYHLSGWKNVIERTYGHRSFYLVALVNHQMASRHAGEAKDHGRLSDGGQDPSNYSVAGILPLFHLKHFLFGNNLISIPFFDLGGLLGDSQEVEKALLLKATEVGRALKVMNIELRHIEPLPWLVEGGIASSGESSSGSLSYEPSAKSFLAKTRSHKVRMLLKLPSSSELLMKSFKAKLRSQIKKPIKEGLRTMVGGLELLEDFYRVFSINMRDLGSPVHTRDLMRNVLEEFPKESKIVVIYKDSQPLACSFVVGFKDTLENPWASSLREYGRFSPNMLLYWSMLEYACNRGYAYFDFGRSSPDEGTYRFKEQWGARPTPLNWHYLWLNGDSTEVVFSEKTRFGRAIDLWKSLPVSTTRLIGPLIRKHIGL